MANKIPDSKTRLYQTWKNMRSRCNKTYDSKYKYYGGKGIKVCTEWDNDFKTFKKWALQSGYTDEMTIDRIDSKKGYSPDNCQWLTMKENYEKMLIEHGRFRPELDYIATNTFNTSYHRVLRGEECVRAKLTNEQARKIREEYIPRDENYGMSALAKKYNVSYLTIHRIIHHKSYKDI